MQAAKVAAPSQPDGAQAVAPINMVQQLVSQIIVPLQDQMKKVLLYTAVLKYY